MIRRLLTTIGAFSIRWHIAVLGFLIISPLILVQAFFLYQIASNEKTKLEESVGLVAQEVSDSVDRVLRSAEHALIALSTSPFLDSQDFAAFQVQAKKVAEAIPGSIIGLRENGSIIVTSSRPVDFAFSAIDPVLRQSDEATLASGKPSVGNYYTGATTGTGFVNVSIPVVRSGRSFVLSLGLTSDYISDLMRSQNLGSAWVVTLTDENRRIVARTRDNDRYAGQPASRQFTDNATLQQGRYYGRTLDGLDVFTSYIKSGYTGWVTGAGIAAATLEAPLWRTMWQLLATAVVGWILATILALTYSRTFSTPLQQLGRVAERGPEGAAAPALRSRVVELNALSEALNVAFERIRKQSNQQELLVRELSHRVKNTLAMVQSIANLSARRSASLPEFTSSFSARLASLGRSQDLLLKKSWAALNVHDVIKEAREPFCDADRCAIVGDDIPLEPEDTIAMGMILHELFTNATKYGALSKPNGRIQIDLALTGSGEAVLRWNEVGGNLPAGDHRGFGTTMIDAMIAQMGASISRSYSEEGLSLRINFKTNTS